MRLVTFKRTLRLAAVSGALLGLPALSIISGTSATAQTADEKFTVALIGDYNYGALNGPLWHESGRMIADINANKPSFVIHNGDIKAGSSECTDAIVTATKAQFDSFKMPLVYLFGDNEWTDCHRILSSNPRSAFGDPFERLENLRTTFYSSNRTQGTDPFTVIRQADVDQQFQSYVENVRWKRGPVMFIGLNIPGSNNNCESPYQATRVPSLYECKVREPAVLKWLSDSFAEAKRLQAKAVFIAMQGNPDFENKNVDMPAYDNNGYKRFLKTLQNEVVQFPGQVVLTHGDSHTQHIDKPLNDVIDVRDPSAKGKVIGSLLRVETFGNPETHWIKMTVDPTSKDLFTFERMIVAGNPAPKALPN